MLKVFKARDLRHLMGKPARDMVTGYQGTVVGITYYISGCEQALVQASVDKDGKWVDSHWFDIDRLETAILRTSLLAAEVEDGEPIVVDPQDKASASPAALLREIGRAGNEIATAEAAAVGEPLEPLLTKAQEPAQELSDAAIARSLLIEVEGERPGCDKPAPIR
jgi:hypothetical protein